MIEKTISHYRIIEKLGEGGMGVVYKAEDMKLDRFVALKFLPSHLEEDDKALSRLLKEAKAASKINHPNVCTIYTIEEHEDTHFIVMEYVDGETLRKKDKPFSIDDSLDYSVQISEALNDAHEKNIIHSDIKSENIMVNTKGRIKVMDFGLAKLKEDIRLTKSGIAGTIAYMSPEQIQGLEIDNKSDIWSFGVVMYEMLTGKLPFRGEYESAMMYSILNTEPEAFISYRTDVSTNLEHVVNKTLEKDRTKRYQNMPELIQEIKKIPTSISVSDESEKSIVVLPFVNISPEPEQEYFSDGLTEEIITDLSHIHDLLVISRSSAMTFKGTKKKIKEIAKEVNVQYVLEGSVRKAGNNLRITAQLIDATTDAHLWAEKYSGTIDDVFDIQEKVSRTIVDALKMKLSPEENKKIAERSIENVQAYECYLKARAEVHKSTEEAINHAIRYLQNAIDIIGENPLLYSGMAYAYFQLVNVGAKQEDYIVKSEEYVKKALAMDPEFSIANTLLGWIDTLQGKMQSAVYHLKKVLTVDPDETLAMQGLAAIVYVAVGNITAAVPISERLMEIDPLDVCTVWLQGGLHFYDGQFDKALQGWKKMYDLYPENPFSHFYYAMILAYNDRLDEAFDIIDQNKELYPDNVLAKMGVMLKHAFRGEKEKASQEMTADFKKTCQRDGFNAHHLASVFALLNEKKETLDWLENAVNQGFINYPLLAEHDSFLENIRGEERFKKLMKRVMYEWENFEV